MCRRWVMSLKKALEKAASPLPRAYPAVCSSYFDVKQSRKADLINCFKMSTLWGGSNGRKCASGLRAFSSKPAMGQGSLLIADVSLDPLQGSNGSCAKPVFGT